MHLTTAQTSDQRLDDFRRGTGFVRPATGRGSVSLRQRLRPLPRQETVVIPRRRERFLVLQT